MPDIPISADEKLVRTIWPGTITYPASNFARPEILLEFSGEMNGEKREIAYYTVHNDTPEDSWLEAARMTAEILIGMSGGITYTAEFGGEGFLDA